MTHSFILRKEEAPVCVTCNAVITDKHILIECSDLLEIRKKYLEERSLYSLFRNVNPQNFLGLPERNLCNLRYKRRRCKLCKKRLDRELLYFCVCIFYVTCFNIVEERVVKRHVRRVTKRWAEVCLQPWCNP